MNDKKSVAVSPETGKTATKSDGANSDYTPHFTLAIAQSWLERGIPLIPLQPGSKHIIPGFGPYSQRIETTDQARFWFVERHANMGLICGAGMVVLDFDDDASHARWAAAFPAAAVSYTEKTRRGCHVHFLGESRSYRHPDGYEVKGQGAVVMASPSQRGGFVYHPLDARAQLQSLPAAFSLLSESPKAMTTLSKGNDGEDLVSRIKRGWPVLTVAQTLTRITSKDGRWWHGRCPFHADRTPSFWVDSERGLWGCYVCGRGDVVNLFARSHNLSVSDAIREMAAAL
jgi:hypothetical protein